MNKIIQFLKEFRQLLEEAIPVILTIILIIEVCVMGWGHVGQLLQTPGPVANVVQKQNR